MDDLAEIIEKILSSYGTGRNPPVNAFYEVLKEEKMPIDILDEICDLLLTCPRHTGTTWLIVPSLYDEIQNALNKSNYSSLLCVIRKLNRPVTDS